MLPFLLANIVIVALGLFVYDAVRESEPEPASEELLTSGPAGVAPSLGTASGIEKRLLLMESRIGALETATARLRLALPEAGKVDTSALRELLPPPGSEIDDRALDALEVHLKEIERRRRLASQVDLVNRNLDRLDLRLNDDERQAVVRILLAYDAQSRAFWKRMADRGITDRKLQLEELRKFKESVMKALGEVIPEQDLERAARGLMGRGSIHIPPGARGSGGPPSPPAEGGYGGNR